MEPTYTQQELIASRIANGWRFTRVFYVDIKPDPKLTLEQIAWKAQVDALRAHARHAFN